MGEKGTERDGLEISKRKIVLYVGIRNEKVKLKGDRCMVGCM